ncbi:glucan biosynthesis protein C [Sphingomonas sp. BK069]|nr:glucan biosynthesis protein C [Sphingomonas sp. BK069]
MISFLHLFRMQGFFMLAGYLAALTISKRGTLPWVKSRLARLLPPFFTALVILVPLMNLFSAYASPLNSDPIISWMQSIVHVGRQTTGHLWFVLVLIYYNVALAILCWAFPSLRTYHVAISEQTAGRMFLPLLLACAVAISAWQRGAMAAVYHLPQVAIHPGGLGYAVEYAPYFALGLLLQRCRSVYHRFNRFSWSVALIGVGTAIFCLTRDQHIPRLIEHTLTALAALGIVHVIVATAARVFDAERKWVKEVVRASFVIYLFHMPVIAGAFLLVDHLAVSVLVRFLLLLTAAAGGSTLAWLVIKKVPALLFAFSGETSKLTRA